MLRYRVDTAELPDALYALWDGRIFLAQRSSANGTTLLVVPRGETAPDGFDTEWEGSPAKVVPDSETAVTFSVQSYCRFDDEIYRIESQPNADELILRWSGQDKQLANVLGLEDFTTKAKRSSLSAIWQERHDFPELGSGRTEPGTGDSSALLSAIGRVLLPMLPEGWRQAAAQFRQIGDYSEVEVRSVIENDLNVSIPAPPQLGQLFTQLKSAMYKPETGTWFQGTFSLEPSSNYDFDFEADAEPNWRLDPAEGVRTAVRTYHAELEYFPRQHARIPRWLAAKAEIPINIAFRRAKVVDEYNEGQRPIVKRQPVANDEMRGVLDYLYRCPVATAQQGSQKDIFNPSGKPDVPNAFHTDGHWIWPAAVPHYLRKYGVPPEPDLVARIRAASFRPPYVDNAVRASAEAEILGKPQPVPSASDFPEPDALTKIERSESSHPDLLATEVLAVLRGRLAEHGIPQSAYRIGESAEGAHCLRRTDKGWEVAQHANGGPTDPVYFDEVAKAAQFLLGSLLLYPARSRISSAEEANEPQAQVADWPILPMRGEPPLTFFRGKRMVVLPAGSTVQRFGNEAGNLVHAESAHFSETSLAVEREHVRQLYQLKRPLRVITGVTLPWGRLPGGAMAYLLPRAIAQHVESGALERVAEGG